MRLEKTTASAGSIFPSSKLAVDLVLEVKRQTQKERRQKMMKKKKKKKREAEKEINRKSSQV